MRINSHVNLICVLGTVFAFVTAGLFLLAGPLGVQPSARAMGYEMRLFDTTRVHTLDILIDDWDGFLQTCENEEYVPCSVVIDGELLEHVGLRAKGNTSLMSVRASGTHRYSMKIEFDHYEKGETYYGLDKLCLNNTFQDNTYMKDYLTYRMMAAFGAETPLCSYVFVTVNQEPHGLLLAVEAVEDSFLRRNYGANGGTLYKPDSMPGGPGGGPPMGSGNMPPPPGDWGGGGMQPPPGNWGADGMQPPPGDWGGDGMQPGGWGGDGMPPPPGEWSGDGMPPGPGSSNDVRLIYTDNEPASYSNIFLNAKVPVSPSDRSRLIQALKILNDDGRSADAVDTDKLIRYFVVHNYTVNGDSYTGSMVHNYYLHERGGVLNMIPWDYNLAFGGFQSGNATALVNDPIDSPLSVSGDMSRPMADWIFRDEEYLAQYHEYYADFLDSVDVQGIINEAETLIAGYVAMDPTAICTPEQFQHAVSVLRSFCELRTESIRGQLQGTVPSTDALQRNAQDQLVDASSLNLRDMGSMGPGGGPGPGGGGFGPGGGPPGMP